jgi:hypothetical protein
MKVKSQINNIIFYVKSIVNNNLSEKISNLVEGDILIQTNA